MELSVREKTNIDVAPSKFSAIGNKRAVPNRLPKFDKGYEDNSADKKPKQDLPKKDISNQNNQNKINTGIHGMLKKQNDNPSVKLEQNSKDSKNEIQTNAKAKITNKNSQVKGTRYNSCFG